MMEAEMEERLSTPSPLPYSKEQKMKVELDKKALFALASDSRMEILKALHPQRRTVAQLADQLGIDRAAVHRHLKKLEEGGLVIRYEDHGFVYYGLSWKARDVISPGENTKIVIVFSLSWLLILGTVSAFVLSIGNAMQSARESQMSGGDSILSPSDFLSATTVSPEIIAVGAILGILAIVMLYVGWRWVRRPKQKVASQDGTASPTREDLAD